MLTAKPRVWLVGPESAGKSTLVNSLTRGRRAYSANYRGSTIACDEYEGDAFIYVDTPGIETDLDVEVSSEWIGRVSPDDRILLVLPSPVSWQKINQLLPVVRGRKGTLVATFGDRVNTPCECKALVVDARSVTATQQDRLRNALEDPLEFPAEWTVASTKPDRAVRSRSAEQSSAKAIGALASLLLPAALIVHATNSLAGSLETTTGDLFAPAQAWARTFSPVVASVLAGRYGLLTMTPLLFVWALPVVFAYAWVLALYKSTGWIDHVSASLEPFLRPFGLNGRDLPRVLMGFGCKAPAVTASRSCTVAGRNACISAISFGGACSYQFGATLAVFAAVQQPWLVTPYLLYLAITALLFTRWVTPRQAFQIISNHNPMPLAAPRWSAVTREAVTAIRQFLIMAMPVFLLITAIASVLDATGALDATARWIAPLMAGFNLPASAAIAIVMGAVRKDGILLLAEPARVEHRSPAQVLTGVYLASVLLPCLVTSIAIARERGSKFALLLLGRQAVAALFFTMLLACVSFLK